MICAQCNQGIRPGEQYETRDIDGESGAGTTLHFHIVCPGKPRGH
ncbi:hypothetical protein [Streptomyces marianii]|nr:hypothetical protein [Streptomyces marianii]